VAGAFALCLALAGCGKHGFAPPPPGVDGGSIAGVDSATLDGPAEGAVDSASVEGQIDAGGLFTLTPTSLDLGKVVIGGTARGTVVMTNVDIAALTGITIAVSGTGFALAPTTTCRDTLAVGQTCDIDLSFTARTTDAASGVVLVSQGGAAKSVSLSVTVQTSEPRISPPTAALTAGVGMSSSPVTFYVPNSDLLNLVVTLGGPNAADFSITSDSCSTGLASAATCQVTVVFSARMLSTANEAAVLTVTFPDGSSAVATLTGTVVSGEGLFISGGPDLGTVAVGATGAPISFTIRNTGDTNSGTITVATNDPEEFVVAADLCTGKDLARVVGTCTFSLQFKPASVAIGVSTARVTVSDANFPYPGMLTVTGTAVPPPDRDGGASDVPLLQRDSLPAEDADSEGPADRDGGASDVPLLQRDSLPAEDADSGGGVPGN
jgi:hypothetical protein